MTILFQLSSSEVGKSKKNRNKKFGGVIIRHIERLFFRTFQINIPQVQIINVQELPVSSS